MQPEKVVVTRHEALVTYLVELKLVPPDVRVVAHATVEDVQGRAVFGVLPLHLAASAASVTVVPLALRPEHRGVELTLDQVRELAGSPANYVVRERTEHERLWYESQ